MADITIRAFDAKTQTAYDEKWHDNGDGTYSRTSYSAGDGLPAGAATASNQTDIIKAEDTAHSSGDKGTMALGVRRDADTSPVDTDGDYHFLVIDALGNLKIIAKPGEHHIGSVGGSTPVSIATFARPGDTTAYAVNDVVSNNATTTVLMTFASAARLNNGNGIILKAQLSTDQKTCVAQFRLYLYNVVNPTVAADNAAHGIMWANRASRLGYIDFPALATDDATASDSANALATPNTAASNLPLPFGCASADSAIYGVLVTKTIFTPASGQNFYLKLTVSQD